MHPSTTSTTANKYQGISFVRQVRQRLLVHDDGLPQLGHFISSQ